MITRKQIEQARQYAASEHECRKQLQESRKALLDSFRVAGFPVSKAALEFESLMKDHAERYQAANTHMVSYWKSSRRPLHNSAILA